jgi:hypothetical protein
MEIAIFKAILDFIKDFSNFSTRMRLVASLIRSLISFLVGILFWENAGLQKRANDRNTNKSGIFNIGGCFCDSFSLQKENK